MRTFKPPADYGKGRQQRILVRLKRWAEAHHVELEKIPEEPERKTPDYRAIFPDTDRTEVIIEAKEMTTQFEMDIESHTIPISETGPPDGRSSFGDPVRRKINDARLQLREYSHAGYPTLLMIGMWNPCLDRLLDWSIPIAMYGGGPQIRLQVEGGKSDLLITSTARGGRQLADNMNRSISGIGRFERESHGSPERLKLIVHRHNNPRIALDKVLPGIEHVV